MVWELATTGETTFPEGKVIHVGASGWFDVVKWLYAQIEGPPKP